MDSDSKQNMRIRKEPFKQKPSHDLVKFEEGLLFNKPETMPGLTGMSTHGSI